MCNKKVLLEFLWLPLCQHRQRQGGCIGRYNRSLFTVFGYFPVKILFDIETLNDDFDDPVTLPKLAQIIFQVSSPDEFGIFCMHQGRRSGFVELGNRRFCDDISVFSPLWNDIQQDHFNPGIGDLGGNTTAHHPRADHRYSFDLSHGPLRLLNFFKNGCNTLTATDALSSKRVFSICASKQGSRFAGDPRTCCPQRMP